MAKYGNVNEMHERILKSALEVFSEKGYSAATIRDISSRAGCNTVTVFRHFEDKLGLFLQVVERYRFIGLYQRQAVDMFCQCAVIDLNEKTDFL